MPKLKHLKSLRVHLIIVLVLALLSIVIFLKTQFIKELPQTGVIQTPAISKQMLFMCDDKKTIEASFSNTQVSLKLSDGREMSLKQAESQMGTRYATEDENFVFWTQGITAFIQEGEQTSFADCSEVQSASPKGTGIVTTVGTILCLPHKNQTGPQTMECAYGLKADNGTYYGLKDSDPGYKNIMGIPMNQKVEVTGVINLSSDTKYDTIGTITIQSIKHL